MGLDDAAKRLYEDGIISDDYWIKGKPDKLEMTASNIYRFQRSVTPRSRPVRRFENDLRGI